MVSNFGYFYLNSLLYTAICSFFLFLWFFFGQKPILLFSCPILSYLYFYSVFFFLFFAVYLIWGFSDITVNMYVWMTANQMCWGVKTCCIFNCCFITKLFVYFIHPNIIKLGFFYTVYFYLFFLTVFQYFLFWIFLKYFFISSIVTVWFEYSYYWSIKTKTTTKTIY